MLIIYLLGGVVLKLLTISHFIVWTENFTRNAHHWLILRFHLLNTILLQLCSFIALFYALCHVVAITTVHFFVYLIVRRWSIRVANLILCWHFRVSFLMCLTFGVLNRCHLPRPNYLIHGTIWDLIILIGSFFLRFMICLLVISEYSCHCPSPLTLGTERLIFLWLDDCGCPCPAVQLLCLLSVIETFLLYSDCGAFIVLSFCAVFPQTCYRIQILICPGQLTALIFELGVQDRRCRLSQLLLLPLLNIIKS